jgi:2-amino-4-hydroxy-6-hydroxymethyldihydropteridine diphosphokinase
VTAPDGAVRAFIGLGSNLEDSAGHVNRAFSELGALPLSRLVARSSLYRTAPVGFPGQPDFVNAVALLETGLAPMALLAELLEVERCHGRVRGAPNGPRTLDLDLLFHGDACIQQPGLSVPHPRLHERAFVVVPLAEIAPHQPIPGHGTAGERAAQLAPLQRVMRA